MDDVIIARVKKTRNPSVARTCERCGKQFMVRAYKVTEGKGRFCSKPCVTGDPETRFWESVDKHGPVPEHVPELGNCWVWTGNRSRGYGQMRVGDRTLNMHRYSWQLHKGATELFVLHKCDNRACVRPDHLFLGDHQDNRTDCQLKGRMNSRRGDTHGRSKVSATQVTMIRQDTRSGGAIAAEYGISACQVSSIRTRRAWKSV